MPFISKTPLSLAVVKPVGRRIFQIHYGERWRLPWIVCQRYLLALPRMVPVIPFFCARQVGMPVITISSIISKYSPVHIKVCSQRKYSFIAVYPMLKTWIIGECASQRGEYTVPSTLVLNIQTSNRLMLRSVSLP